MSFVAFFRQKYEQWAPCTLPVWHAIKIEEQYFADDIDISNNFYAQTTSRAASMTGE